jgi:hypothetical protein
MSEDQVQFILEETGIDVSDMSKIEYREYDALVNGLLGIECDEVMKFEDGDDGYEQSARYQMAMSILSYFERQAA